MTTPIRCEDIAAHPDFIRLADLPGVAVELRYATPNNFVGRDLYSPLDCAWIRREAAEGIARAYAALQQRAPGLRFLMLDALRPQRVQEQLWDSLQGTGLEMYLANPARGSIHSFGMAVDITLIDADGRELDMGTPFDDLSEKSHPKLEADFLARGELTTQQLVNRQLLREVLTDAGFRGISTEWWHFDFGDREFVRATLPRVL
jgi:zinc D-Ala-D-Ala dipeptidase